MKGCSKGLPASWRLVNHELAQATVLAPAPRCDSTMPVAAPTCNCQPLAGRSPHRGFSAALSRIFWINSQKGRQAELHRRHRISTWPSRRSLVPQRLRGAGPFPGSSRSVSRVCSVLRPIEIVIGRVRAPRLFAIRGHLARIRVRCQATLGMDSLDACDLAENPLSRVTRRRQ